jgi:hypothetical protein
VAQQMHADGQLHSQVAFLPGCWGGRKFTDMHWIGGKADDKIATISV